MPVAFLAVLHQPTRQRLDLKRVSRLVVLPDYQGVGIGRAFLDAVAALYISQGHMFEIKTSARNLIGSLRGHPASVLSETPAGGWRASSWGFNTDVRTSKTARVKYADRSKVKTATFVYEGTGCPPFAAGTRTRGWSVTRSGASARRRRSGSMGAPWVRYGYHREEKNPDVWPRPAGLHQGRVQDSDLRVHGWRGQGRQHGRWRESMSRNTPRPQNGGRASLVSSQTA